MQTFVYLISNLVHMYAVYILFKTVLGKSIFNPKIEILTYVAYYIINSAAYLLANSMIITLFSNIVPMFIIMFQYKKPIQTYVFLTFGVAAVGMFIDWFALCVMSSFILVQLGTPQSSLFLGLVFIFRYYFNRKERIIFKSKYVFLLILISLGTIIIAELINVEYNFKSMLIALILMIVNFLNFFLYDRYIEDMQMRIAYKTIQTSNQAYKNQFELMNESQKQVRLLKHDMKNHILKIKLDLENKNYPEAMKYTDEIIRNVSVNTGYVNTGNVDIDCLLNYKLSLADQENVEFEYNINLPDKLQIETFDLVVILGNLLDNSLNALKDAEVKLLKIDINYSIGMIVIRIENTFSEESQKPKSNDEHGYGLISVRNSLAKYDGKLYNDIIDDKYTIKAILYNISSKF
ncbi:MAG: sensor histidine kinase [Candidatus Gastranaerophilaceae bacterium]